jgi:ketosteroid isomerase-like protein
MGRRDILRPEMPSEQIELVRRVFAATQNRDFETVLSLFDPEVELVVGAGVSIETGSFQGREAVGGWFTRWFGAFMPGYRLEIEEICDLGDRVAAAQRHTGRGRSSEAPVEMLNGSVHWVRAGKVVRIELYADAEQALNGGES